MAPPHSQSEQIGNHEGRIKNLEDNESQTRAEQRADFAAVFARLDLLAAGQIELKTMVEERAKVTCARPGLCLDLDSDFTAMKKTVNGLVKWRTAIVAGSAAVWVIFLGLSYMAWDGLKMWLEHKFNNPNS